MERNRNDRFTFGNWKVLNNGSLYNTQADYHIDASRLHEPDWIPHLHTKAWMENQWEDFMKAMLRARSTVRNLRKSSAE